MSRNKRPSRPVTTASPAREGVDRAASEQPLTPGSEKPIGITPAMAAAGVGVLLATMIWSYWPTLAEVWSAWMNQPDYSHGILVAPLAAVFLYVRRGTFPAAEVRPAAFGLGMLGAVSIVRLLAGRYYLLPIDAWTIPFWVAGSVWLLFGWSVLRWSLPSIVFLWFMFPMPYAAESWLSVPLQAIAAKVSTAGLVMLGQPAIAEGNTIWIGDTPLNVAEACSGLRIFMSIFAMAFVFVLFFRWAWWQKALALIMALPVAIVANAVRIIVTGLLFQFVSGEAAHKFMHDLSGLVMIPFAGGLLWLFLIYIERIYPEIEMISPMSRLATPADRE
jgi:exosortase